MLDAIFLVAAVIGGTVMVCQFVLTLLGMGEHFGGDVAHAGDFHGGHGADFHGDAHAGGMEHSGEFDAAGHSVDHHHTTAAGADGDYLHPDSSWLFGVISFRTLVAASAFFGLAGKAALSSGFSQPTSFTVAALTGVAAMYGMYWLMRAVSQLSSSGNERISNALGRRATVYVAIPGGRAGAGKVQLSMQNRIVEFQAVTEDPEPLKSGESVEVVAVAGSDLVSVRRIAQPARAEAAPSV